VRREKKRASGIDLLDLEIIYLLTEHFSEDYEKVAAWLETPNPNFGDITPLQLMRAGRSKKVLEFILNAKFKNQYP